MPSVLDTHGLRFEAPKVQTAQDGK